MIDKPDSMNTYPECKMCGGCCHLDVIAMTIDEAQSIFDYMEANCVTPHDSGGDRCIFMLDDNSCQIYPARPQTCRFHNCTTPLKQILDDHPEIVPLEEKYYVDMRKVFLEKDFEDPRNNQAE